MLYLNTRENINTNIDNVYIKLTDLVVILYIYIYKKYLYIFLDLFKNNKPLNRHLNFVKLIIS